MNDPKLNEKYDAPACAAVTEFLERGGYTVMQKPDGEKGIDLRATKKGTRSLDVEVAVRPTAWSQGRFLHRTLHLEDRKLKKAWLEPPTEFVYFALDDYFINALVAFEEDIRASSIVGCPTTLTMNEEFADIPIAKCLQVNLRKDTVRRLA